MSDFKAKMHKIRSPLLLHPRPRWGAYSALPDPLAVFKGPTFRGGREKSERKRDGNGPGPQIFWPRTIDVKNFFLRFFYFGHVFTFLKRFFYFPNFFLFLKNVGKVQSGKQINKKHFQNNSNEIAQY